MKYSTVQFSMEQCSTVKCSMVHGITVKCSTVQCIAVLSTTLSVVEKEHSALRRGGRMGGNIHFYKTLREEGGDGAYT